MKGIIIWIQLFVIVIMGLWLEDETKTNIALNSELLMCNISNANLILGAKESESESERILFDIEHCRTQIINNCNSLAPQHGCSDPVGLCKSIKK